MRTVYCQPGCIQEENMNLNTIPEYLGWAENVYTLAFISTSGEQHHNLKKNICLEWGSLSLREWMMMFVLVFSYRAAQLLHCCSAWEAVSLEGWILNTSLPVSFHQSSRPVHLKALFVPIRASRLACSQTCPKAFGFLSKSEARVVAYLIQSVPLEI